MEWCGVCGCELHRQGRYGTPTVEGRSHATGHHYVAERFFGRSQNRRGEERDRVFETSPWGFEGESMVLCYDCHELLIHNPVLLPEDLDAFAELVRLRHLDESEKTESREKLAGRVMLFHEVIARGLRDLLAQARVSR